MNPEEMLPELKRRVTGEVRTLGFLARGHYLAGKAAARLSGRLNLVVIGATALTGTGLLGSTAVEDPDALRIVSGILALIATAVSGAQKAGNYSDRAAKHQAAGTRFERLRAEAAEMEFTVARLDPADVNDAAAALRTLQIHRAEGSAEAPDLVDHYYNVAVAEAAGTKKPKRWSQHFWKRPRPRNADAE